MEFQHSYFKSYKHQMLWKCCIQYVSKFGKLSSGHRTGKGQFSFQTQRRAMPKNVRTTVQFCSSHMLVKQCSKFSKPSFNSTWTMNFQMSKLDLEKAGEQEIKLKIFAGSSKKQESSRKTSTSALLTTSKPLLCGSQQTVENSPKEEKTRPPYCLPRNLYADQEATVRTGYGIADWSQIGKGVHQGCRLSPCLFNLYADCIMQNARLDETQAGIKISRRNINNLRYADDTTLMAESKE